MLKRVRLFDYKCSIRLTNSLSINMSKSEMLIFILGVGTPVFSSKLGHCLDNYFAFLISS